MTRLFYAFAMLSALTLGFAATAQEMKKPSFAAVNSALLKDAPLSGDFLMGKPEAPVTIIEYASLSCPHCAHFHKEVLAKLKESHIDTGKVNYILRPFPLNDPALKAAQLADCVGEQDGAGRYYTFVQVLFDAQDQWAFDNNYMKALKTFAGVGGVNAKVFTACTTSTDRETKILSIRQDGEKKLGVDHTPYIFINGHRYDDEPTLPKVTAYINSLLGEKGEKATPAKSE